MEHLEETVRVFAAILVFVLETASIFTIAAGATAFIFILVRHRRHTAVSEERKTLTKYLIIALELQLAADIVSTAVDTSWEGLGKMAAIAAIRTFLNFFLLEDAKEMDSNEPRTASK